MPEVELHPQHWTMLYLWVMYPPPMGKSFFSYFWIEATLDYVRPLGDVQIFTKLSEQGSLFQGSQNGYKNSYAMVNSEQKLTCPS